MCKQSNQQNAQCKMESGTMKIETQRRGSGLPLLSLLSLMSLSAFAIPVMPYGTYLVKGSFKGDYNTVMRDFGEAKVRAQRADGTVEFPVVKKPEECSGFFKVVTDVK